MADLRFYNRAGPFTLQELAALAEGSVIRGDEDYVVEDVATLSSGGARHIAVLHNSRYIKALTTTKVGACIVASEHQEHLPHGCHGIITPTPYRAYAIIAQHFYPLQTVTSAIHPTAVIDPTAQVGPNCTIGPYAVIGPHAIIGANVTIGAHVIIDRGVTIGDHCRIDAHVCISFAVVGQYTHIKPGAKIGQQGFGFFMEQGGGGHVPVPQLGRVIIGSSVQIGTNTTIDRGSCEDTIIGDGSQIDNLVQIAHNVALGSGCVLVSQSGIAGSTQLEDYVIVGGQVGISGHLTIGKGARIAGQSGVVKSIEARDTVGGTPAVPIKMWHRQSIFLKKMTTPKGQNQ